MVEQMLWLTTYGNKNTQHYKSTANILWMAIFGGKIMNNLQVKEQIHCCYCILKIWQLLGCHVLPKSSTKSIQVLAVSCKHGAPPTWFYIHLETSLSINCLNILALFVIVGDWHQWCVSNWRDISGSNYFVGKTVQRCSAFRSLYFYPACCQEEFEEKKTAQSLVTSSMLLSLLLIFWFTLFHVSVASKQPDKTKALIGWDMWRWTSKASCDQDPPQI